MIILQYMLILLAVTAALLAYRFRSISELKKYFSTEDGKKIASGIIKFVGVGILFGLLALFLSYSSASAAGEWFKYTEVRMGVDMPNKTPSPQCEQGFNDDFTSNGGLSQNIYYDRQKVGNTWFQIDANIQYTHHSCALGDDRNQYDAIGPQIHLKWFWR